ncbi:MAG: hypothetical protein R3281_18540, partial [Balneolaceae bacterium]|nr:hypothetical protein [Balneolaceae bacterium]
MIAFLLMEGWLYSVKPSSVHNKDVYQTSLDKATQTFRDTETELLDGSRQLAERLEARLQTGVSRQSLFEALQSFDYIGGVTLFRDSAPQIWSGFSFPEYPDRIPADGEPFVDVRKQNNVILMLCRIAFSIEGESGPVRYNLITTRRIEQKNALPIGRDKEYSLLTGTNPTLKYPVELSFFEPFPTAQLEYRVLSTASSDSVGIAYAPPGKFNISAADWQQDAWFWRSMFSTFAFALLFIFFYLWFERRVGWQALFFQVGILFVGWLFFSLLAIPDQWLLHFPGSNQQTNRLFSSLVRKSVFVFLIALTLSRHLWKMQDKTNCTELFRTLIFSGLFGFINVLAITAGISHVYRYLAGSEIQLFDLQIFPSLPILISYLSIGLLLFSIGYALTSMGYFLLKT